MIYPEADKLETWGSKYSLVVLAARRAKQIKNGAPIAIDTDSLNPLTIALEEIASGKVDCRVPDNDLAPTAQEQPEIAQLLAVPAADEDVEPSETLVPDEEEEEDVEEEDIEVVDQDEDEDEPVGIVNDEDSEDEEDELDIEVDEAEDDADIEVEPEEDTEEEE